MILVFKSKSEAVCAERWDYLCTARSKLEIISPQAPEHREQRQNFKCHSDYFQLDTTSNLAKYQMKLMAPVVIDGVNVYMRLCIKKRFMMFLEMKTTKQSKYRS